MSCVVRQECKSTTRIQQFVFFTINQVKSVYLYILLFSFHSTALGKGPRRSAGGKQYNSGSSGVGRISEVVESVQR